MFFNICAINNTVAETTGVQWGGFMKSEILRFILDKFEKLSAQTIFIIATEYLGINDIQKSNQRCFIEAKVICRLDEMSVGELREFQRVLFPQS